jgi:histone deacetylase complex regulatory component SIN3
MSNKVPEPADDDMRPEYDFSGRTGVRGKYYQKLREGYTIKIQRADGTTVVQHITRPEGTVTLDPDVREYFPDAEAVNTALRTLIQLIPSKKAKRAPANTTPKSKSS